jgi:CelD/BcsL family acetyltransferase involved in cellulose biosynthesis
VPLGTRGETVAVAALQRDASGVLRFLGGHDVTDYPGPAIVAGAAEEAADAVLRWLASTRGGWQELDVRNARPQEGFAAALARSAPAHGLHAIACADEPVAVLRLPATPAEHRAALGRRVRHELRRKERRLRRHCPGAVVRTADARTLARDLDTFVALHHRARGAKGAFLCARRASFFAQMASDELAAGRLRLDALELDGHPLAMSIGFHGPRTFYLYNMAFDPTAARWSPGILLVTRLIERAIDDGLERFDFLRGLERYKLELGGIPSPLCRVRISAR